MKKSKFTEEQIAFALRQAEAGTPVPDIARKLGISEVTFYRWKKRLGGMGVAEVRRLRQLEEENKKLKQLVADLSLDKKMLQDVLGKSLTPARRREVVAGLRLAYGTSERRACAALAFPGRASAYVSRRDPQDALRVRLRDLAGARVRYGYRRLHVLLRREGWEINHKRTYRIYSEESLAMRSKTPRRHASCQVRAARPAAESADRVWAMDFMSDALTDGRRFRVLTVVDTFTREGLAARADFRFTGDGVVRVLEGLVAERATPAIIRVDNGPEFIGRSLDLWAYFNGVKLDFSRPGKPTDNAIIESFNGRLRQECLDPSWFLCLDDARAKIESWRSRYNREHPHSALGYLAPGEFAAMKAGKIGPMNPAKVSL